MKKLRMLGMEINNPLILDAADEIREMRDILKIIANERFIPAEWERLTGRIQAALEGTKGGGV